MFIAFTALLLLAFFTTDIYAQGQVDRRVINDFGMVVKNAAGPINYTKEDLAGKTPQLSPVNQPPVKQNDNNRANCELVWQDAVFGTCIGAQNSLLKVDLDGDGQEEIIANANAPGSPRNGFWYVLAYSDENGHYEKRYVSDLLPELIDKMALLQLEEGTLPVLALSYEQTLMLIALDDFSVVAVTDVPGVSSFRGINQIRLGDANNDGTDEVIVSSSNRLVLLNPVDLSLISSYSLTAGDFAIGNVDNDDELEIVFTHGQAITLNGDSYTDKYDFRPDQSSSDGFIELSDLDNDGKEEAIVASAWYSITTYEVELEAPKYEIEADLDIDALLVQDINGDDVEDIVYGDGQWGYIYGHNGITGSRLWSTANPEHGTTGIAVGDFDGDTVAEIMWGAGCSSTGSDYLFVNRLGSSVAREWQSEHIDGPYYALEVADVDDDGDQEIVTVSYESESGYDSGIISIYDANSKELEFRSSSTFLGNVWTGVYNVEIADFGNDGDTDIIIAAGETYDGRVFIVDGDTHVLEYDREFGFQEDVDEFYALAVGDLDGDNVNEYVAVNEDNLLILNDGDLSTRWTSTSLPSSRQPRGILIGNVDQDDAPEIILVQQSIFRFDDGDYLRRQSDQDNYVSIELYDWDDDGITEIIGGTEDGKIDVLDGTTLEVIDQLILGTESIENIKFHDLNEDGEEELILTSDGNVVYATKNGQQLSSQWLSAHTGTFDAFQLVDYNNDGKMSILFGTSYSIAEMNSSCAACLWFAPSVVAEPATCGLDNGLIRATLPDQEVTYSLGDLTFTDSLAGVTPGTYSISVASLQGCRSDLATVVASFDLTTNVVSRNKSCFGPSDGFATAEITEGASPFTYEWSTGATNDSLLQIGPGTYTLTVTDANDCRDTLTATIAQDTIISDLNIFRPSCEGEENGRAAINVLAGAPNFTYMWDGNEGGPTNFALSPGEHTASVISSRGCMDDYTFLIDTLRVTLATEVLTASCNGTNSGSARVTVVEGTFPFNYQWSDNASFSSFASDLSSGQYEVTVTDWRGCRSVDSIVIENSVLDAITSGTTLNCFTDRTGSATVAVTQGTPPFSYEWDFGSTANTVTGLSPGVYFVFVRDSAGCLISRPVEVTSPPPLGIQVAVEAPTEGTEPADGTLIATATGGVAPYSFSWSNGNSGDTLNFVSPGDYTLQILDANNCTRDTLINVEYLVSQTNQAESEFIDVFPNPTVGEFTINYHGSAIVQRVQLMTASGRLLPLTKLSLLGDSRFVYDDASLPPGLYYVLLHTDRGLAVKKLIKQ